MIDYFFRFASEDEAIADAGVSSGYYKPPTSGNDPSPGSWNMDRVMPDVKAWRPSQDTQQVITNPRSGDQMTVTVHTYLSGWFAVVNMPDRLPALINHANLQFALDRDACREGRPFVIKNNVGAIISDVSCEPMPCGSVYPVGGYN